MNLPLSLPGLRQRHLSMRRRDILTFYAFASPWLIGFLVFSLGPMLASLVLSLHKYDMLTPAQFIGLQNYGDALVGFDHKLFLKSLDVTITYALTAVPLQLVGAFLVALLMNQKVRGIYGFRLIYYLPAITSGLASALLWKFVFQKDFGILNYWLSLVGIAPVPWLDSTKWALPSLVLTNLWTLGGPMIIYLAGFKSIPEYLYEAAHLDGAGPLQRFWFITIPMMSPVIFFNLIMGIIGSFQVFTYAYAITGGGPGRATYFYMLYLFQVGFRDFRMGYASALAWLLFIIIAALTYLAFRTAGTRVYYEGGDL